MRKLIIFENITLDGFFAGLHGEYNWAVQDEETSTFAQEGNDTVDTFIFGHTTYNIMANFWPTPAGMAASPLFANILNNTNKIVFSRTLDHADWQNTHIIHECTKSEMQRLKETPGKDMMIFGSGNLVSQLAAWNMIDVYQLIVNPLILGKGIPLFQNLLEPISLHLQRSQSFPSGIVFLEYIPDLIRQ